MLLLIAAILGLVEGFTEFLPVSSTGHLILAGSLLGFTGDKAKVFEIVIQTGAIFAVIGVYWARLGAVAVSSVGGNGSKRRDSRRFVTNVLIGFLPAVVLGLLFGKAIQAHLFTPVVVASTFIAGGLIILWAERKSRVNKAGIDNGPARPRVGEVEDLTALDALKVGLVQCLALVPGTSRSGATIIGGMLLGLSRKAATEFSFFLAIPTLLGAGAYSLYKERALLSAADLPLFAVGLLVSFFSAWICVRWLLRYVATHDFIPFAWYRIVFGIVVLVTAWGGWVHWAE
ncbi:MAG: undecaprenol kinase [Fibrobacteria bacterium]|jgi:undecaprenyl-diphosphatase|nr:undecaprenol kinase [Fibrobacteria bacterium]